MATPPFWVVDQGGLRPGDPASLAGYRSWVSLHNHSCHSVENIASLNWVVELWYMRPLAGVLQWAFGLARGERLDYRQVSYNPPLTPDTIRRLEQGRARGLGLEGLLFAITDHDQVRGSLELLEQHAELADRLPVGIELSIRFRDYVFHLGVTGLPAATALEEHDALVQSARAGDLDAVFARLRRLGCLVVLNHPLLPWHDIDPAPLVDALLAVHGAGIHALELNGLRSPDENRGVIELARRVGKPLVGGGDSHLRTPSSAGSVTRAATFDEFTAEVKAGTATTIVTPEFFMSLGWRLALRVLNFMAGYRAIARFRGEPVARILDGKWVALDLVGPLAGWVIKAAGWLGRLS
jgi:hypothetical protein